jgi:hypothetical protein
MGSEEGANGIIDRWYGTKNYGEHIRYLSIRELTDEEFILITRRIWGARSTNVYPRINGKTQRAPLSDTMSDVRTHKSASRPGIVSQLFFLKTTDIINSDTCVVPQQQQQQQQ